MSLVRIHLWREAREHRTVLLACGALTWRQGHAYHDVTIIWCELFLGSEGVQRKDFW